MEIIDSINKLLGDDLKSTITPDSKLQIAGLLKLDSISMRLIAIGEGFKNIDKLSDGKLLINYPNIPWKQVKGI